MSAPVTHASIAALFASGRPAQSSGGIENDAAFDIIALDQEGIGPNIREDVDFTVRFCLNSAKRRNPTIEFAQRVAYEWRFEKELPRFQERLLEVVRSHRTSTLLGMKLDPMTIWVIVRQMARSRDTLHTGFNEPHNWVPHAAERLAPTFVQAVSPAPTMEVVKKALDGLVRKQRRNVTGSHKSKCEVTNTLLICKSFDLDWNLLAEGLFSHSFLKSTMSLAAAAENCSRCHCKLLTL